MIYQNVVLNYYQMKINNKVISRRKFIHINCSDRNTNKDQINLFTSNFPFTLRFHPSINTTKIKTHIYNTNTNTPD